MKLTHHVWLQEHWTAWCTMLEDCVQEWTHQQKGGKYGTQWTANKDTCEVSELKWGTASATENAHSRCLKFFACVYLQMTTKMSLVCIWGMQINFSKQVNSQIHNLSIMRINCVWMHLVNSFKAQYKSQNNLQNKSYFGQHLTQM